MTDFKHKINAAIQIIPKSDNADIYPIIDKAIQVIQNSGLKYTVTPMETVLEGYYNDVIKVISDAQQAALEHGANELLVNVKFHIRKSGNVTFEEKIGKY